MTTETLDAPQQVTVPPHIESPYDPNNPKKIKYAKIWSGDLSIYEKIYNKYAPKIPLADVERQLRRRFGWDDFPLEYTTQEPTGELYKSGEREGQPKVDKVTNPVMVSDPDVFWVGRFVSGLVFANIFPDRKTAVNFLGNSIPDLGNMAGGTSAYTYLTWQRPGGPEVNVGFAICQREPGELMQGDVIPAGMGPQSREPAELERWATQEAAMAITNDFEPVIIQDPFGMFYLKRGDIITAKVRGWPHPNTNKGLEYERRYVLKPPSEGPSLQLEQGPDGVVDLGSLEGWH